MVKASLKDGLVGKEMQRSWHQEEKGLQCQRAVSPVPPCVENQKV